MNKLRIHERMCTPCSEFFANVDADIKNTSACTEYALVLKSPVECVPHPPQQMQIHPRMRAYATVQQLRCHGNYCELS